MNRSFIKSYLFPMIALAAVFSFSGNASGKAQARLDVVNLHTEYQTNPIGIDIRQPRLSWQLRSDRRGVMQSAYQIRVAMRERDLRIGRGLIWDSGKVSSDESIQRVYKGPPLRSSQRYYWRVRVWDANGLVSDWSKAAFWEMGLQQPSDWQAKWIEPDLPDNVTSTPATMPRGVKMTPGDDSTVCRPAPMLRRTFKVDGTIKSARLYVTAHGLYEIYLNGRPVGDYLFTPGWTSYNKRLQYQTYDVTPLLRSGDNAVGALLGDGWYRGFVGGHGWRNVYGDTLGLLSQLNITYADGREEIVGTDSNWKATTGPILWSDLQDGEAYDARSEKAGWTTAGYDEHDWRGVKVVSYPLSVLVASVGPPVRRVQEIKPVKIFATPAGETVADFGQNMVGWVRLKVTGASGTTVKLQYFEVLDQQGNVYIANLRAAAQTERYTCKGPSFNKPGRPGTAGVPARPVASETMIGNTGRRGRLRSQDRGASRDGRAYEVFEPHFTFHGFRYVGVNGYPGKLTSDTITGIVIHSDMERAGELMTSNPLVNQLQHAIVWGQKGNFLDAPMDCPQRNERLGWTGDAVVSARTNMFNYDVAGFFSKWLKDLALDQLDDGNVPRVVPDVRRGDQSVEGYGRAGWGDAAVLITWAMYLEYGDTRILEEQYGSMVKWVEYERTRAGDDYVWDGDPQYGDWVAIEETDKDLFATAFFAHSTDLLRRTARLLNKHDDEIRYAQLFENIKTAFVKRFVTLSGTVGNNTQTCYLLALQFDLLPADLRTVVAARLADDVRKRGQLTTGFAGTALLNPTLSQYGYSDEVYRLLLREDFPSWMYMITHGATTIWERWDGIKPDGSFQKTSMNSFNHRVLGSIGEWMWSTMAGIDLDPAEPGYKHIFIQPQPGGGITWVRASHKTMYGTIGSNWSLTNGRFELNVEVPPNTHATVRLPNASQNHVLESGRPLTNGNGVYDWSIDGGMVVVKIGSGHYSFRYLIKQ